MVDSDSIYLLFYLEVGPGVNLVTYVRRRTSRAPCPHHDVAGQCINMDLCEAEVRGEASLGGADVAAHSCQIEKQPATWKARVVGCCWIDTDLARLAGPAQDRRIGGPAARQPACRSQRLGCWPKPGVKLTWKYASSVVPNQTGGLVHAQAIKSDSTPLQR